MNTSPEKPDYKVWSAIESVTQKTTPHQVVPVIAIIVLGACFILAPGSDWLRGFLAVLIVGIALPIWFTHAKTSKKQRDGPSDTGDQS